MTAYQIISVQPTIYHDAEKGVVNGVLVRVRLAEYDEMHDLRAPKMDANLIKVEIEKLVEQRDVLAAMSTAPAR